MPLAPASATPRAMLVEDNDREREALATFLRNHGVDVVTAGDGEQAIDYLGHHPGEPEVLLLDMGLPRCDGAAVIRAVRSNSGHERLKIIVISGHSPEEYDLPAGSNSFDHWFQKPIDPTALLADLNRDLAVPRPATAATPRITAGDYHALAALGLALIAVYLSLIPFSFRAQPFAEAWARFCTGMTPHAIATSDFFANVLLFIPLGYFVLGAQCANVCRRTHSFPGTTSAILLCGAFSMCLEFAQVYAPPRTADLNDVMAQFLGACIGAIAWHSFGSTLTERCAQAYEERDVNVLAPLLLAGYVALLVLLHLLPLGSAFQPALMWWRFDVGLSRALAEGLPQASWDRYLWNVIYFLPAGILAARLPMRRRRGMSRVPILAFLTAAVVKSAALLSRTAPFDPWEVIAGALAFILGWSICRTYQPPAGSPGATASCVRLGIILWVAAGWFVLAPELVHGIPTALPADARLWRDRLENANWLPLAEFCTADPLVVLQALCQKGLVFIPLGMIASLLFPRLARVEYGLPVFLLAIPVGLVFELGLVGLPRECSVSAVLFEAGGAWLGFGLSQFIGLPSSGADGGAIRRTLPC